MLDLNDLYFFAKVVERSGFTAASRSLGVTKSRLSRRIQNLESALGVVLIRRSSRRFALTELGAEFYQRCRALTIEAEEAENVVRRLLAEPAGRVRFSCPVVLGHHVLADLLPRFMRAYPKVEIVQRLSDAGMDLLDEGFDLALRVHGHALPPSTLIQRKVCRIEQFLVASPVFLDLYGRSEDPAHFEGVAGLARDAHNTDPGWTLEAVEGTEFRIGYKAVFFSNDWITLGKVAAAGFGIAALPAHVCRQSMAEGALERVLPQWRSGRADVSILTPTRRGTLPAVRAFADFLATELPGALG